MPSDVTELLLAWNEGDDGALNQLIPVVQGQLRRLAHRYVRHERQGHTLQTTAVVNEAYIRLVDVRRVRWQDRVHFFAIAATLMRRILVDYGRARRSLKRGAAPRRVSLDRAPAMTPSDLPDLIALADALEALSAVDARKSRIVELRFFGGLSVDETAEALQVSTETVKRDWRLAKVWLLRRLETAEGEGRRLNR